jgi:hypothetical protein
VITAPEESLTVPDMLPVVGPCPKEYGENKATTNAKRLSDRVTVLVLIVFFTILKYPQQVVNVQISAQRPGGYMGRPKKENSSLLGAR